MNEDVPPPPRRPRLARSGLIAALVAAWFAASAAGLLGLMRSAATPGDAGSPPAAWPADSALPRPTRRPLLVMMAHPRCSCTAASLEELSRMMAGAAGKVDAIVAFDVPSAAGGEWTTGTLWNDAAAIPGVRVVADRDGIEARRFRTATSGHVLLYDAAGRLLYSGGMTVARAHAGDNAGLEALASILRGRTPDRREAPVYGCALDAVTSPAGTNP
ncbi:MAG TPA: RedB protein [Candidatus Polarisedimenticolia bacterium]|jgi:hypothetical protein|nr:RedB protein [Candidatus Polarisedimenticolia bacterium]